MLIIFRSIGIATQGDNRTASIGDGMKTYRCSFSADVSDLVSFRTYADK